MHKQKQQGFTLVELAIVLVIIGLIVGGVLVGQDLIKAATVRSTLGDIEKYNAAATTFRNKYSGLPGDLLANNAVQFGLISAPTAGIVGRTGAAGLGDGNGLIEGCATGAVALGCETALFWRDLTTAGLIPQNLGSYDGTVTTVANVSTIAGMAGYLPTQKLRQGTFAYVYSTGGRNFFTISTATTGAAGAITLGPGATPSEGRSMDEKMDDALPTTGVVIALAAAAPLTAATAADAGAASATGVCVNTSTTPASYNAVPAFQDEINCRMRMRASF